jgi:hypothetical protein
MIDLARVAAGGRVEWSAVHAAKLAGVQGQPSQEREGQRCALSCGHHSDPAMNERGTNHGRPVHPSYPYGCRRNHDSFASDRIGAGEQACMHGFVLGSLDAPVVQRTVCLVI